MKTKNINQIAKECGVDRDVISYAIKNLGIEPIKKNKEYCIDEYQEDLIHQHLVFILKIKEVTFESKMNFDNV